MTQFTDDELYAKLNEEIGNIDIACLLEQPYRASSIKSMAYKTVEVFAGIKKRRLYLKDNGLRQPCTDGHVIEAPLRHARAYQYVEHELSHILFDSNAHVRNIFIEEYAKTVTDIAAKNNVKVNARELRLLLTSIVAILDDERVISLWGTMYRGSAAIMRKMKFDECHAADIDPFSGLIGLFTCIAARHPAELSPLSRYVPYFHEALRKVQGRDYHSVLVTTKWLFTYIVAEVVREFRKLPPPSQPPPLAPKAGNRVNAGTEEEESEEEEFDNAGGTPGKADESEDELKSEPWDPPVTVASVLERSHALDHFLQSCEGLWQESAEEISESKFKSRGAEVKAHEQATAALGADIRDATNLEEVLGRSERRMQELIQQALDAMRGELSSDDRVRRDAMAAVKFQNVEQSSGDVAPLTAEDLETVQRLKSRFIRILGRQTQRLDDVGMEIDIPSYIIRRLTHEDVPVFRSLASGRGFRSLILVDRSGSMQGEPTTQADRACRIIARALQFPFVANDVWGFQSLSAGEINIQRHVRGTDYEGNYTVGGCTPLHTAIRLGVNHLEKGSDCKQLFVITDGKPIFSRKDGGTYDTKLLIEYVRNTVQQARSNGIGITGVLLGNEMTPINMRRMFGPPKYWRILDRKHFGDSLLQLVTGAFVDYLKNR